nr:unnamed protein product [Haemonchus contortus]
MWAVVLLLIVSVVFALPKPSDGGYEGHESLEEYKREKRQFGFFDPFMMGGMFDPFMIGGFGRWGWGR